MMAAAWSFDQTVQALLNGKDVPGEWEEGWWCEPDSDKNGEPPFIHAASSMAPPFSSDQEAVEYVKRRAAEGSVVHQAVLHVATLACIGGVGECQPKRK